MFRTLVSLAVVALGLLTHAPAEAQVRARRYPSSVGRPTVSPYLNLLRRNNDRSFSTLDYFTLVRPQLEFRASLDAQARRLDRLGDDVDANSRAIDDPTLRSTGHTSYFLNYGRYYPGLSSPRRAR